MIGKGCVADAPCSTCLQRAAVLLSAARSSCLWPAERSEGQSRLGKALSRDPGAGGGCASNHLPK